MARLTRIVTVAPLAAASLACLLSAGCASTAPVEAPPVVFRLAPSASQVEVGTTVTVVPLRENIPEGQAEITWACSGGAIETFSEERIAQVTFEQPGSYSVIARVFVDGDQVARDAVRVRVEELGPGERGESASAETEAARPASTMP